MTWQAVALAAINGAQLVALTWIYQVTRATNKAVNGAHDAVVTELAGVRRELKDEKARPDASNGLSGR
jgi:hypothetical protein